MTAMQLYEPWATWKTAYTRSRSTQFTYL